MINSNKHLFIIVIHFLLIAEITSNLTTECGRSSKAISSLDIAMDMIRNVKENFPVCPDAKSNQSCKPIDCEDLLLAGYNKSGSYKVWPKNRIVDGRSVDVYCDMDTDGGGWIVIQRRGNYLRPNDYFYQDWSAYKSGFGDIEKDFWLGNDNIFALTNQRLYSVRFDLKDVEGAKKFAVYESFWIDDENQKYTLHIKDYRGDAGDSMRSHNNMKFSTKDADNDVQAEQHCSQIYKGGWWYGACHEANLNGLYLRGKHDSFADGVNWKSWKDYHESLDATEIKIRPKNFHKRFTHTDIIDTPR